MKKIACPLRKLQTLFIKASHLLFFRTNFCFYYTALYHLFFDSKLEKSRQKIIDLIPEKSTVLDIGCGTGERCLALLSQKKGKWIAAQGRTLICLLGKFARIGDGNKNIECFVR